MKLNTKKGRLFACVLCLLILLLAGLSAQISSRIVISQNWQRAQLTNNFADSLQDNAIFRARSLDPETAWLKTEEDVTPQIRSYIEENLASIIRLNGDELSKDSNLAWIVNYKGQEYRHNWQDSYDQNRGAIDYSIRSDNGKITYSGAIQPTMAFSRELSILVNPSIVPEERLASNRGSEYLYTLVLPNSFSIRYYVPSQLKANGGAIARMAYSFDTRNIMFCMLIGSGILLAVLLLWRWSSEKQLKIFSSFRKLKALSALLLLGAGLLGIGAALQSVCSMNADGTLQLMLQSFGVSPVQAKGGSFLACFVLWAAFFGLVSLGVLYLKSIFADGFIRWLKNDTVSWKLLQKGQDELLDAFAAPSNSHVRIRFFLIAFLIVVVFALLMTLGAVLGQTRGLLIGAAAAMILLFLFLWSAYHAMNASFKKVYAASEQLARGNFEAIQPEDIGFYQPLYEELIDISESYQTALKEGLSSQITKTQLISNISHDLKTPVTGIQSYSELITLSNNMEDIHEYAKRLSGYSLRLADLITDLFDVARATSGDIQLEPIDLDFSELVMQVAAEWEDQFEAKRLKMVLNLMPNAMLRLDPKKTVRVMENLLGNICKYSLENSRVFIDLYAQDGLYQLVLKNTSRTEMTFNPDMIVERFVRGDASRHESGSGLGLAIVKSFVEVQQGTFEVKTDGDLFKACISFAIPPVPQVPQSEAHPAAGQKDGLPSEPETPVPAENASFTPDPYDEDDPVTGGQSFLPEGEEKPEHTGHSLFKKKADKRRQEKEARQQEKEELNMSSPENEHPPMPEKAALQNLEMQGAGKSGNEAADFRKPDGLKSESLKSDGQETAEISKEKDLPEPPQPALALQAEQDPILLASMSSANAWLETKKQMKEEDDPLRPALAALEKANGMPSQTDFANEDDEATEEDTSKGE